jgi:hypothetical protein
VANHVLWLAPPADEVVDDEKPDGSEHAEDSGKGCHFMFLIVLKAQSAIQKNKNTIQADCTLELTKKEIADAEIANFNFRHSLS